MNLENRTKDLESLIQNKGRLLLSKIQEEEQGLFDKSWWQGKILSMTLENDSFKTRLFHFIDVLPNLKTSEQIISHLEEYFKDDESKLLSSGLALGKLAKPLLASLIKKQIHEMAKIFITGSTVKEALQTIQKIRSKNQNFSLDILGEATLSEKESQSYQSQYLELINTLDVLNKEWPFKKQLDEDSFGNIPKVNISVKVTSLYSQIKEEAWENSKEQLKNKIRPLFKKAIETFSFINLDMEQYKYKNLVLEIFKELLTEKDFKNYPHFGIVIQAYLKESFLDLEELIQLAKKRNVPFTVRLVKGAYWDSEVLLAQQKNWPIPVYTQKEETDFNFERCNTLLMKNYKYIKTAVGSHNIRSISHALALKTLYPQASLEFQTLYGMGDTIAQSLSEQGGRVRLYATIGELIPGMSYFVRRLLENTSNQSFIRNTFKKNISPDVLLKKPNLIKSVKKKSLDSFKNHPLLDFSLSTNRDRFQKSLDEVKRKIPMNVFPIIEGKEQKSDILYKRKNPSHINQMISHNYFSTKDHLETAVEKSLVYFNKWKYYPADKKIDYLLSLAQKMKEEEFTLSAIEVLESGKTWLEAQADVAEAIDFCIYYARQFENLSKPQKTYEVYGEDNISSWEPLGLTAVISPWNFPLAILTGMVVAPLVCGNTVIIKPAEQSSLIAYYFAQLLLKSGFPKESFAFLPGEGETIGASLVKDHRISIISFTGSLEVGSSIIKETSQPSKNKSQFKKSIVEMGGKNAIIVDESADLDEAIQGILESAFRFQGQKCSACSRIIVLEQIYDRFMKRFMPSLEDLIIGPAEEPKSFLGPVVDKEAFKRIKKFIEEQKKTSQVLFEGKAPEQGYYIPPTVFSTNDPNSPLMQKEIFGPVLSVFKTKDFSSALEIVNQTPYGLTAGLYSRHPSHIEEFKKSADVGNLYINRNCTGALVKRHPFGGRKLSGLGSKTGGPEYLKQFLKNKIATENTIRRGFSADVFDY